MLGPLITYAVGFVSVACCCSVVSPVKVMDVAGTLLHPNSRPSCQTCSRAFPCHNQWPRVLRSLAQQLQLSHLSPLQLGLRRLVRTPVIILCTITPLSRQHNGYDSPSCCHHDILVVRTSYCCGHSTCYAITPALCSMCMPHGEVLSNPRNSVVAALTSRASIYLCSVSVVT